LGYYFRGKENAGLARKRNEKEIRNINGIERIYDQGRSEKKVYT
jgi:hypothetical protein